ncbi:hypothetical protein EMIHUDRAFT_205735 [Emiliania huxleyi CCMP1516]|uniref:Uncharacterized protein n=2 Tax=Emiliania huxleyi TaxID=2903 RepID=A0A0D3JQ82_EMIH1|nr:hypothetical protein EMIHUDRAFT_205735 [Emiliania huxleyi CCMP1516]EOD25667.1 hypothetical protein EMIHUDRAFT_205735 [Emiliania huxleyi CCMP1516]|eukprot:XP_005778096.1 hypothetical protein EMIHUDRAFT_205735 [Emiliania huxleyi CCMP1516]
MSAVQAFSWCQDFRKIEAKNPPNPCFSRYLRGKPLIEPSVPAAASRAAPPLRNRIDPMEEEGAVGQRSRRSPSPRRSPLQSRESSLAMKKAALQEHAKMQWLACFDSALSAAEVGLERVGVDAD